MDNQDLVDRLNRIEAETQRRLEECAESEYMQEEPEPQPAAVEIHAASDRTAARVQTRIANATYKPGQRPRGGLDVKEAAAEIQRRFAEPGK